MSRTDATGKAKEIVEQEYRRRQGDIVTAYNNAHDGTNGGLRAILDIIAEKLKAEGHEIEPDKKGKPKRVMILRASWWQYSIEKLLWEIRQISLNRGWRNTRKHSYS